MKKTELRDIVTVEDFWVEAQHYNAETVIKALMKLSVSKPADESGTVSIGEDAFIEWNVDGGKIVTKIVHLAK